MTCRQVKKVLPIRNDELDEWMANDDVTLPDTSLSVDEAVPLLIPKLEKGYGSTSAGAQKRIKVNFMTEIGEESCQPESSGLQGKG